MGLPLHLCIFQCNSNGSSSFADFRATAVVQTALWISVATTSLYILVHYVFFAVAVLKGLCLTRIKVGIAIYGII